MPGRVRITGPDTFEAELYQAVEAVTPGQATVVYDENVLLGGGWIEKDPDRTPPRQQ